MKRIILICFSFVILLLTSCGNTTQNKQPLEINTNHAVNSTNLYVEPQVKKENKEIIIVDFESSVSTEGILIETPSTLTYNGSDYIFGFFGYDEHTKIADVNAPTYHFGIEFQENIVYAIPYNVNTTRKKLKAIYFLKHNFYYKGFKQEEETIIELDKPEITTQTFYTIHDLYQEIPKPIFNSYREFDLYNERAFKNKLILFYDLDEFSKGQTKEPIIYALVNHDGGTKPIEDFNYYELKSHFDIDETLNNFVLTRDNLKIVELTNNEKYERYNHGNYIALYNRDLNNLFVLLSNELKITNTDDNQLIIPTNAINIDISGKITERIFQDQSSLKGLFLNSKARIINLTNTIDNTSDVSHLFSNAIYLEEIIGFETINTHTIESIAYMFYNTKSLNSVNLENLDTLNVIDGSHFFHNTSLNNIDISHLETNSMTELKYMFANTNGINTKLPDLHLNECYDMRVVFKDAINVEFVYIFGDFRDIEHYNSFLENAKIDKLILSHTDLAGLDSLFKNTVTSNLVLKDYSYGSLEPLYEKLTQLSRDILKLDGKLSLNELVIDISRIRPTFIEGFFTKFSEEMGAKELEIKELDVGYRGRLSSFFKDFDETRIKFDRSDLNTWHTSNAVYFDSLFYNYKADPANTDLILNFDLETAGNIDHLIYNANFTSITINSPTLSTIKFARDAFTAPNLETLKIKNVDLASANVTLTKQINLTEVDVDSLPIDYVVDITDLTHNPNRSNMKRFVIGSVDDNNPRGFEILLNQNFSFNNIEEFKLDNLNIPRIESYNSLFKGFAYEKGAVISAKDWVLKNPKLDLTSMFEGVTLFSDLGYNWQISNNANMTNMFKNATLSEPGRPPFDLKSWSSTTDRKITVKTYTHMFEGVSTGFKNSAELNLSKFNFDTTTEQTIATKMKVRVFVYDSTTDTNLKLFAPALKTAIDNKILKELYFNRLVVTSPDLSIFKALPFSTMFKLRNNNLSFSSLQFTSPNTSLADLFKDVPHIHQDVSWIVYENVTNIDGMFSGANIDLPLRLNLKEEVSANRLFQNAIINAEITQVHSPASTTPKITSINNMFDGAIALKQLNLDTFNIDNPTSAKFVFQGFRFNDGDLPTYSSVLESDRILNITGWDFKNYLDDKTALQRFFYPSPNKQNNIYRLIYNKADVYSFIALRNNMARMASLSPINGKRIIYWDFKYLYLHDTNVSQYGSQFNLIDDFESGTYNFSNLKSGDLNLYLDYLFNQEMLLDDYATSLETTDFSTWKFSVTSFCYCFAGYNYLRKLPETVDLSNVDVTSCDDYVSCFKSQEFKTLITNNWNMTKTNYIKYMFLNAKFTNWIFSENFTPPAKMPKLVTDCWLNCSYKGDIPANFPSNKF